VWPGPTNHAGRTTRALASAIAMVALTVLGADITLGQAAAPQPVVSAAGAIAKSPLMTMEQYLDRVMMAESGGRTNLRSSSSTALGPYQFIERTFIDVARRNFPAETTQLTAPQLLARRTDPVFSRRVAEAFTRENARHLRANDIAPAWTNLRLAFLLGPAGAVKLLKSPPGTRLAQVLTPGAMVANPFMAAMTAQSLTARAAREVGAQHGPVVITLADRARAMALAFVAVISAANAASQVALKRPGELVIPPPPAPLPAASAEVPSAGLLLAPGEVSEADAVASPAAQMMRKRAAIGVAVTCNLNLPSCRKWLALKRDQRATRAASR
jgi:hypothetical protein